MKPDHNQTVLDCIFIEHHRYDENQGVMFLTECEGKKAMKRYAERYARPLTPQSRIDQALQALGYTGTEPSHHRSNLLHAIAQFAGLAKDVELENQANALIDEIKKDNIQKYGEMPEVK